MSNISIKKDFQDGDILPASDLNNNFMVIEAGINANDEQLEQVIEDAITRLDNELREILDAFIWHWNTGEDVTFYKGTTSQISEVPITNGQLLYNTQTGETALDTGGNRIVTGSGNVVAIGNTQPTNSATKIWINPDLMVRPVGTEVIDTMTVASSTKAPSVNAVRDTITPINGLFISSVGDPDPSSIVGYGTWTLVDKIFSSNYGSSATGYWLDNDGVAECTSFYWVRSGHTIQVGITLTTKTAISDTSVQLGTLNLEALGVSSTIFTRRPIGYSDDGDLLVGASLNYSTGVLSSQDIFPHGTLASGSSVTFNIDIISNRGSMVDAKCNQFVWKRTA